MLLHKNTQDLKGQTFGKLIVVEFGGYKPHGKKSRTATWVCKCSCDAGTVKTYISGNIKNGHTISCGCEHRKAFMESPSRKTHGFFAALPDRHAVWRAMINRCNNPNNHAYKNYGARGIEVEEYFMDPWKWYNWIVDNLGECPSGHSMDRIENNGNYERGNLKWSSALEQNRNRRISSRD